MKNQVTFERATKVYRHFFNMAKNAGSMLEYVYYSDLYTRAMRLQFSSLKRSI